MGLDAVEIVMRWEETFGIRIENSEAFELITPKQAIDLISTKLCAVELPSFCPGLRAFHVFRRGIVQTTDGRVKLLPLNDRFHHLHKSEAAGTFWKHFSDVTGIANFKPPRILFGSATVRKALETILASHLRALLKPGEPWTRQLVRCGVRYGVVDIVGARNFSDDARFVEDIGID